MIKMTVLDTKSQNGTAVPSANSSGNVESGKDHGHLHMKKKHPTSYIESLVHLLKGNVGSGVFALGEAFKHAGILVGSILTVFIGVSCLYCEHMLLTCSNILKEKKKLSYYPGFAETIQLGFQEGPPCFRKFANFARSTVNLLIIVMQLGFCCVYILFASNTSKSICDGYGYRFALSFHTAIVTVPLTFSSLLRSLKFIVPISLTANIFITFGIISTLYLILQDLPPITSRPLIGDWRTIPLFFGTAVYSFEGIGLVLPIKTEMKKPTKFDSIFGVLNVGMVIIILIFLTMGFFSYLKYGNDISDSVTLNLPQGLILSKMVKIAIGIGIMFTYALMFYVPMEIICPYVHERFGPFNHPNIVEISVRLSMVFVTFLLAEGIPHLGLFISLIGAFCSAALSLVIPTLCDISMRWPSDFGKLKWRLWLDIVALILSLIGVISGTYYSIEAIVMAFIGKAS